ncbi:hypothetical protein MKY19_07745 [Paenibacillus sp. FSL R5-0744]|uniref:hypothetical protein n=1 Tax=Paenibacillus sp. FSL R5-0744 TaxID=2921656 RepID=UPI0030DD053F
MHLDQKAMFTTKLNNYHILKFRKMIVDYANSDLLKDFVQMRINKIVDPLYTNQDTKEFAIFNGKASGTIEEGTTDDLKAFTSSDFSAGFLCECRAADEGCPRSSEIHRGLFSATGDCRVPGGQLRPPQGALLVRRSPNGETGGCGVAGDEVYLRSRAAHSTEAFSDGGSL